MRNYEAIEKKTISDRFWDLFYSTGRKSPNSFYERLYEEAVCQIAKETRAYIERVKNSSAVSEIAERMLQKGVPESFTVSDSFIRWSYPGEGEFANTLHFDRMGLPDLSRNRALSGQVSNIIWNKLDVNDESYYERFVESTKADGAFYKNNPDLFGIGSPLWIDECMIVGVVLSNKINACYTYTRDYANNAKFVRRYSRIRAW